MCKYNEDERIIGTQKFLKYKKIFAKAGEQAVLEAIAQRRAITYIKNNQVIQEYPDGRKKVLAEAPERVNIMERAIQRGLEIIYNDNHIVIRKNHSGVKKVAKTPKQVKVGKLQIKSLKQQATYNSCIIKLQTNNLTTVNAGIKKENINAKVCKIQKKHK